MRNINRGFILMFLLISIFSMSSCIVKDKRSVGNIIDDQVIATKILHELAKNSTKNSLTNVSANVCEGRVLLTHYVTDVRLKDKAESIAWLVWGVKEVINDIGVAEKNEANIAKDLWIKTKLKTKFLVDEEVHSVNYQITVYKGIVYLLGIAESQKELNKVLKIASGIEGVSKVKNYVVIKNDIRRNTN